MLIRSAPFASSATPVAQCRIAPAPFVQSVTQPHPHTPTRPHLDSRLNSVVTIRSHRLSNSSAHAYPLRNRSSVCVVQLPYHRGLLRSRSGSIPLQGFSSGWPLSDYSPLFAIATYSFSALFPIGSSPIRLHFPTCPLTMVWVSRSYLSGSFGYNPAVQTCRFPCSSSRYSLVRSRALGLYNIVNDRSALIQPSSGQNRLPVQRVMEYCTVVTKNVTK